MMDDGVWAKHDRWSMDDVRWMVGQKLRISQCSLVQRSWQGLLFPMFVQAFLGAAPVSLKSFFEMSQSVE